MNCSSATKYHHERILAQAMICVASELRLTDATELVRMIGGGHSANIADLVDSSSELYFRKGTLRYALFADYSVRWETTPVVRFDMEFHHERVSAFFRLVIERKKAGIEALDVIFEEQGLDDRAKVERLTAALATARV